MSDLEFKSENAIISSENDLTVFRSNAAYQDSFVNIDVGTNAKNGMTWQDYNYFRPEEALPRKIKGLIKSCDVAYFRVPIVRTAVDLMSDFGCQGIHIVHPNSKIEKFHQDWFNYVNGYNVSERFLNYLYRRGNVAVHRTFERIRETDMDKLSYAKGGDFKIFDNFEPKKNELPLSYAFLDVCGIDVDSPELTSFMGEKPQLSINLPMKLRRLIKNPKSKKEKELVKILEQNDPDTIALIRAGKNKIPLNPNLISTYYYKKDDWMDWAMPPLACILDSLIGWEKMQLADRSALDGAISNIRLWKLGDLERGLVPSPEQIRIFSDMLTKHPGGGTLDLIWHAAIELVESKTTVHQFLGAAKYEPIWQAIFQGLGIPPTLTGSPTASGTTNNFIALKTLIERLEYGRSVLKRFWQHELQLVQKAKGFRFPAEVHFERMSLSDEVAEKALLRDLYDRGLLSGDALLERFGEIPDLERIRTVKEDQQRENGRRVPQAGPFHNAQQEHEYNKIALQSGYINRDQVDNKKVKPLEKGQTTPFDKQVEIDKEKIKKSVQQKTKKKGVSGQGRPKNKRDSTKRKSRTVKPRTSAEIHVWAADMQERISELVVPDYLKSVAKKNLRQISSEQFDDLEFRKFATLAALTPFNDITDDQLLNLFNTKNLVIDGKVYDLYQKAKSSIKNPTVNNLRQLQILSYVRSQRSNNVEDKS